MTKNKADTIKPPKLPKSFAHEQLLDGPLTDEAIYADMLLEDLDVTEQTAAHIKLQQTLLRRALLSETRLASIQALDVAFEGCDMAGAEWYQADLRRVSLAGCRLLGFAAAESRVQDALFKDCNLTMASFRFTVFKAARFERCVLKRADFGNADLSGVVFAQCDLSDADLSGAKLAGADFRSSDIAGLKLQPDQVRGAIVDYDQAILFARQAGLIVKGVGE